MRIKRMCGCLLMLVVVFITRGCTSTTSAVATIPSQKLNRLLRENLIIECQRTGIRVSFKRPALADVGIEAHSLCFYDFSCRASNNGTHYVLTTTFTACGGYVTKDLGRAFNRIYLLDAEPAAPAASIGSSVRRRGRATNGRSDDEEDETSGSGDRANGDPANDATTETSTDTLLWNLPFMCEYATRLQMPNGSDGSAAGPLTTVPSMAAKWKLNMSMTFFQPSAYVAPLKQYPLRVGTGEQLFVQVQPEGGVSDGASLRAAIKDCYLTSGVGDGSSVGKRVVLVENGCTVDKSVVWHSEEELASFRRFSFRMQKQFSHFTFLHCFVDLCSLSPPGLAAAATGLRQCIGQSNYCHQRKTSLGYAYQSEHVHSGPLVVYDVPAYSVSQQVRTSSSTTAAPVRHLLRDSSTTNATSPSPAELLVMTSAAGSLAQSTRVPLPTGAANALNTSVVPAGLAVGTVIGIAIGAFVVGGITVGVLWAIHTHTDPRRRMLSVPTTEDSGSQTSRSPMSV